MTCVFPPGESSEIMEVLPVGRPNAMITSVGARGRA
jgi:hypothetical protein